MTTRAAIGILVFLAGCSERGVTSLGIGTQALISDQAHNGGTSGFWFLPPLVHQPAVTGTFAPGLAPVVKIDHVDGGGNPLGTVAQLAASVEDDHYIVPWHTPDFDLDPYQIYRIRVLVGTQELGFADVNVVANGRDLKSVDTNEYVPLLDGRTLPLKFRINTGVVGGDLCSNVVCAPSDQCHEAGTCNPATGLRARGPNGYFPTRISGTARLTASTKPFGLRFGSMWLSNAARSALS
jgi:hypothetical protein